MELKGDEGDTVWLDADKVVCVRGTARQSTVYVAGLEAGLKLGEGCRAVLDSLGWESSAPQVAASPADGSYNLEDFRTSEAAIEPKD